MLEFDGVCSVCEVLCSCSGDYTHGLSRACVPDSCLSRVWPSYALFVSFV